MPIYLFYCSHCDRSFEIKKLIAESGESEVCPFCGLMAERKYTPIPFTFGFRLTERSHQRFGPKEEMERDI